MKLILGVTGGSGSGKTQLSKLLSAMGARVIDADRVAHEILEREDVKREILTEFGDVTAPDGSIDRRALGGIVFSDPEKLALLNLITHRHVIARIEDIIHLSKEDIVVIDAVELNSTRLRDLCAHTIAIIAPRELRIKRIVERDGISREDAQKRLDAQKKDSEFTLGADFVIINNGTVEDMNLRMLEIFEAIN